MKPISPMEATQVARAAIPDEVIAAFNELIVEKLSGKSARITQDEAMDRILTKLPRLNRNDIFEKHYMDVEPLFRNAGWKVEYDSPAYCETYKAYYVFTK